MENLPSPPTTKAPAVSFTGDVWFDVICAGEEPSRMRVNLVRFAPGAHTAWHQHAMGQTLHVTEGRGLVQSRGGDVVVMNPGDTVHTPPGEWHWHGATPDDFMCHLAMWESPGPGGGVETEWGDLLGDDEYPGRYSPQDSTPATTGAAPQTTDTGSTATASPGRAADGRA